MATRAVDWPRDLSALALSLARSGSWFWLDGGGTAPGEGSGMSYLGAAVEVRQASRGREMQFIDSLRAASGPHAGVSGPPFASTGWVVAFSYEFGVALLGEDPAPDDAPPAFALRANTVLMLDHGTGRAFLLGPDETAIDVWLRTHGDALREVPEERRDSAERIERKPGSVAGEAVTWRRTGDDYLAQIGACLTSIREGDAYVLCLTDTAELSADSVDPLQLFLRLRATGAAARGGIIVDGSRALVSASPERFLSKRGSRIATHPIKGTRPRGADPDTDAAYAAELAADPKERAENLMIVDLMRNDLSRTCHPGSVRTEGLLRVETHPRVHQLVSTVSGNLLPDHDIYDVLLTAFPGGSMTGAPKQRAVQLLAELEGAPRGLYSGCFGWIGGDGDAELAMTIRAIEVRGLGSGAARAFVGAGGGITVDSDPAAELAEKELKAAPLIAALTEVATEYP